MTALLYFLRPEQVLIAMDSLVTEPNTAAPRSFVTKILPVPHLSGVICGTGTLQVLLDWFSFVQENVVARDIVFLNNCAQGKLKEISVSQGAPTDATTTIYHFGYSTEEGKFAGYAFRSEKDFQCERLIEGFAVKPPDGIVLEDAWHKIEEIGFLDGFSVLIRQMKDEDERKPPAKRVGIGGEIHIYQLLRSNFILLVHDRFKDYEEAWQAMLTRVSPQPRGAE